ncbi:MAG: Rpn family recombination-promoting nuclease/putative transposase [Clostridiales Family XIII bacterium]|nr:Rpn family recombination-promoting nuclease/putative transposase [Clostridiales Family XIII bacterium]
MAAENDNKYDKGYRRILSHKRNFYDFVKNHIAAPWVDQLDAEYLKHVNAKFVTKDLKDKESDIIYKAKIENRDDEELDMTYAIERAFDDMERRGIRKGKREGKREVAEKMIIRGRSIEEIIEDTGLTYAEVEALRAKVQLS